MDPSNRSQHQQAHVSTTSTTKGKEPVSNSGLGTAISTTAGFVNAIAVSARNAAAALDPRQADAIRQHHSTGLSSSSSSSGFLTGSSSKAAASSSATRSFQQTTHALETLNETRDSRDTNNGAASLTQSSGNFRSVSSSTLNQSEGRDVDMMNWDNFLASSDSTLQDEKPYQPPAMSSFAFEAHFTPEPVVQNQHRHHHQEQQQHSGEQQFESVYQAHLSQPLNLTPANHAAFLEYLKSTAHPSMSSTSLPSSSLSSSSSYPSSAQHPWYGKSSGPVSNDIQRQIHMDGSEVLAFLDSTSYSDFVDELESAGNAIEKHQQDRREFVYSETSLGPSATTRALLSTLQLIQNLPTERQDIVQYLLNQGTYAEDVWSRPFGHDQETQEGPSLAATRAEQSMFLKRQHESGQEEVGQGGEGDGAGGGDATTEEMERILKQIVDDAKEEVKTGDTNGRALNRLVMVRSHITMGTKL